MSSCCVYFFLYFLVVEMNVVANSTTNYCPNTKTPVSSIRKRRHLAFPDGSAASITISGAKSFLTHVPSGWMMTTDLDVLYPLPDMKFTLAHARRKLHHRQKRYLWETLRTALDYHNYNGRACILKSICEAKVYLAPPGRSLVHDMLRVVFTMGWNGEECILRFLCEAGKEKTKQGAFLEEIFRATFSLPLGPEFDLEKHKRYDAAHGSHGDCSTMYPKCEDVNNFPLYEQ